VVRAAGDRQFKAGRRVDHDLSYQRLPGNRALVPITAGVPAPLTQAGADLPRCNDHSDRDYKLPGRKPEANRRLDQIDRLLLSPAYAHLPWVEAEDA